MKRILPNILLVVIAFVFAFLLVEIALRVTCKVLLPSRQLDKYHWSYVDVFNAYFRKIPRAGVYVSQKRKTKIVSFPIHKEATERRIFVIGESVAGCYDADTLVNGFSQMMPQYTWKAIVCGVGGYESFPILLVMDEIVKYRPDLILLMMGNNYGTFGGMTARHWAVRHPVVLSSWTIRLLLAAIFRPKPGAVFEEEEAFRANLQTILERAEGERTPLIACTLPQNRRHLYRDAFAQPDYADRGFFEVWWILQTRPSAVDDLLEGRTTGLGSPPRFLFPLLADAYERTRRDDGKAHELIGRNLDVRRARQGDIVRRVLGAQQGNAMLCDLDRWMMKASEGLAGYEYFYDACHYWPQVYEMISKEVLRVLCEEIRAGNPVVLDRFAAWRPETCAETSSEGIEAFGRAALRGSAYVTSRLGTAFTSDFEFEENRVQMKAWYAVRPAYVRRIMEFGDEVLQKGGKETWGILLSIAGEVLREEGLLDEAMEVLDESLRMNPENALAYFYRGLCWYDRRRTDECTKDWTTLKKVRPGFVWLTPDYLDELARKHSP